MIRTPDTRNIINRTDKLLNNPYKGFMSFQHFRDEALFSDCDTTGGWVKEHYPVYDWVEQRGREQGYYPDTEIAYFRILWKDFEKEEGNYDYSVIDQIFVRAKEENQSIILRLMPHTTRENEDVPDWLRAEISCPKRPPTERVKDSPSNPIFLEKFGRAIKALGARYDGAQGFYAMDISLTGAWGEGHGFRSYHMDALKALVDAYISAFEKTHLLGQLCSPELLKYAQSRRPVGFRADCLGNGYHMNVFLPKSIYEMGDTWKTAPISFETFWYLTEWKKQGWDIDEIIEQSLKWHISSLNAKSSTIPHEWREKIEEWIKKMGYRFAVRLAEYPSCASSDDTLELVLWIENSGVAPIYSALPFTFRLKGEVGEHCFQTEIDARGWLPGDSIERLSIRLPKEIERGEYSLEFRLGGGDYPLVRFASDAPTSDNGYIKIGNIKVK
ncbi:MAG: DUF4832 domain-containing protein [Clostridia bacterium]|nr:DUF4832 domain-containing protein [Clostridia bacterium]